MDLENLYRLYQKNRLISTDSRNITPGCIFFALKGDQFNGNQFALQAIEKGAAAAVVDEDLAEDHPALIRVDHVLKTLQSLATFHRNRSGLTILAITGSNGKTTTKELCNAVLSKNTRVFATQGNLNNHIGVPLTLLSMDHTIRLGIVEMGANHPGEIRDLCSIAQPDMGLITNVGKAHLEGFGDLEGVARAKGELFAYLMSGNKTLFLNEGNPYLQELVPAGYTCAVRYNGSHGLRIAAKSSNPLLKLDIVVDDNTVEIETNLLGQYNAENILAACCVGLHFGVDLSDIRKAISEYRPKNHRSQLIDTGKNRLFMDAYNANPSSMKAAVDEFLQFKSGEKLLIIGEMREMGESAEKEHEELIHYLHTHGAGKVICLGGSFRNLLSGSGFLWFEKVDELVTHLQDHPVKDHFILVKGSRANLLEKVIPLL